MSLLRELFFTILPLLWNMTRRIFAFFASERAVFGMFFSGLFLVFTGHLVTGVAALAKAAFLLFAGAFGIQLATTGVKITMLPLIEPLDPPSTPRN